MKCEHGCGTELDVRSGHFHERNQVHTPERCQAATRALLDEARRELAEWERKAEYAAENYRRRNGEAQAAEKCAVEAERERDEELFLKTVAHAQSLKEAAGADAAEKRAAEAARLHVVDVLRRERAALAALVPSYDRGKAEEREAIVSDLRIMSRDMFFPEGTRNAMSALAARFRDGLHLRPATTAEKSIDVQPAAQNTGKSSR